MFPRERDRSELLHNEQNVQVPIAIENDATMLNRNMDGRLKKNSLHILMQREVYIHFLDKGA